MLVVVVTDAAGNIGFSWKNNPASSQLETLTQCLLVMERHFEHLTGNFTSHSFQPCLNHHLFHEESWALGFLARLKSLGCIVLYPQAK
jgi:hypothetical protein